jgi:hypothetical protein
VDTDTPFLSFGAVLEEFEVKDALSSILAKKGEADNHMWEANPALEPMNTTA